VIGGRRWIRSLIGCTAILALMALVAGCAGSTNAIGAAPRAGLQAGLTDLPHRSVAPMPTARLARGLAPPTNRWFSGLVFGSQPQPVFPLPLSFGLTGTGFAFGVPTVTTDANTIAGEYAPSITVDDSASRATISAYDEASVTIAEEDARGSRIGSVVIAEGSPIVTYTAARNGSIRLAQPYDARGNSVFTTTIGGAEYGLLTHGGLEGGELRLTKGQTALWFAVPNGGDPLQLASHVSALRSVSLAYGVSAKKSTTSLAYHSDGNTMIAALPSQLATHSAPTQCGLGHYASIYGTLTLCAGKTLTWSTPALTAADSLDATKLTGANKSELRAQLARDISATPALPSDSYFGGKALYRLANLLTIAHQIGDETSAATLQKKLDAALQKWTEPDGCAHRSDQCFVYDTKAKGIVGLTASFGSDQFNDHHFHYGYFLYAASVAAQYDPAMVGRIAPVMNLLAADIASPTSSAEFPRLRVFDPYAGHSWASGYAPFADGNNQESSSEAVDAWNGLALWAAVTKNSTLRTEATWLLSSEAAAAKTNWTNFDATAAVYDGYQHGVVGINWGGKRDSATWFSADANAKLGIQLIPMSPASNYLGGDPQRIRSNVQEATPGGFSVSLGDYLLMYSALGGKAAAESALATARTLPAKDIDDANSRTYLLAWIMTR
jgi:endo-1,3(4)-beta-glucanase